MGTLYGENVLGLDRNLSIPVEMLPETSLDPLFGKQVSISVVFVRGKRISRTTMEVCSSPDI